MTQDQFEQMQSNLERAKASRRFLRRAIQDDEQTLEKQKAALRFQDKFINEMEALLRQR